MREIKSYVLRGGAWALFGKIASALVSFGLVAIVSRVLSPNDMGIYFLVMNLATFFSMLGRAGLENTLLRFIARAHVVGKESELSGILTKGWFLVSVTGTVAGVCADIIIKFVGPEVFGVPSLTDLSWLIGVWSALLAGQFVLGEIFRGLRDIPDSVIFGGLFTGVLSAALLSVAALLGFRIGVAGVLMISVCAVMVNNLFGIVKQSHLIAFKGSNAPSPSLSELVAHSWPVMVNAVTLFLLGQADLWILAAHGTEEKLALYGAASRIVTIVGMALVIANMVVPPLIAQLYSQKELVPLERIIRGVTSIASIPSIMAVIIFYFLGDKLLAILYGQYYGKASNILIILSIGYLFSVLSGPCGYVLLMTGNGFIFMLISIASLFLAISLGTFSIERFGAAGLAGSFAVATILQRIALWIAVWRHTRLRTHFSLSLILSLLQSLMSRYFSSKQRKGG